MKLLMYFGIELINLLFYIMLLFNTVFKVQTVVTTGVFVFISIVGLFSIILGIEIYDMLFGEDNPL